MRNWKKKNYARMIWEIGTRQRTRRSRSVHLLTRTKFKCSHLRCRVLYVDCGQDRYESRRHTIGGHRVRTDKGSTAKAVNRAERIPCRTHSVSFAYATEIRRTRQTAYRRIRVFGKTGHDARVRIVKWTGWTNGQQNYATATGFGRCSPFIGWRVRPAGRTAWRRDDGHETLGTATGHAVASKHSQDGKVVQARW